MRRGRRVAAGEDGGLEEVFDAVRASESRRDPDETGEHRTAREDDERRGHRGRRLVEVLLHRRAAAEVAPEGHDDLPGHVEGGHRSRRRGEHPQRGVATVNGLPEDFVLAEEPGERRNAGDRHGGDHEGVRGPGQVAHEAAHVPHVLHLGVMALPAGGVFGVLHGVDHAARPEKEARLEESVGHQVEDRRTKGSHAGAQEHVAELGNGGVGEDLLDVVLEECDGGCKEGGYGPHGGHQRHRRRGVREQHAAAGHHVDPGGHHGRRVDQGGNRGRPLHRIGQPHIERDLRRLAGGADEEQHPDRGKHPALHVGSADLAHDSVEIQGPEGDEGEHHSEDETGVPDPVHDERLLPRRRRRRPLEPEPDQQVGAEPDPLPTDEHDQHVRPENQVQHEEREQVQVGEEPAETGVVAHVAERVDVDQQADAGDHQDHQHRERVEAVGPVHPHARDPGEKGLLDPGGRPALGEEHREEEAERDQERGCDRTAGERATQPLAEAFPEEAINCCTQPGNYRDEPEQGVQNGLLSTPEVGE